MGKLWDRCANVMVRGWKRVDELESLESRRRFLMCFCEASCRSSQPQQARAVLAEIEEPEGNEAQRATEVLRCQVCCANGDVQEGLAAFNRAIRGEKFKGAYKVWEACSEQLSAAGGFWATRQTLESLAQEIKNDEDARKLAMEQVAAVIQ